MKTLYCSCCVQCCSVNICCIINICRCPCTIILWHFLLRCPTGKNIKAGTAYNHTWRVLMLVLALTQLKSFQVTLPTEKFQVTLFCFQVSAINSDLLPGRENRDSQLPWFSAWFCFHLFHFRVLQATCCRLQELAFAPIAGSQLASLWAPSIVNR